MRLCTATLESGVGPLYVAAGPDGACAIGFDPALPLLARRFGPVSCEPGGAHALAVAARLGRPTASRAVAAANGANPVAIVIPCHRVIGADGSLTGYGGGLERKRRLLAHERGAGPLFA